jgi:hypothetical protein
MMRFAVALTALVSLVAAGLTGSAAAAPYHSPGYSGKKTFASVTTTPFPPITIGSGKYPNLLVDESGTAHVVFAQDGGLSVPDLLSYCNLQRGLTACASSGNAPTPQAPEGGDGKGDFSGNSPGENHDFDGPVPLAIGNQLYVVDRRFPDVFKTPGEKTSDSNVFEWSSVDGGATLTGPGQIGDNQTSGGAIAYGDPSAPSIGTISATETGGTFFQGSSTGNYTTSKAKLGEGDQAYYGKLALDGTQPVAAFADLSGNVFVREYTGQGDVNDASSWTSASFPGFQPQIIGGAAGVYVMTSDSAINGGNLSLRRIAGGQPVGAPVALGASATPPRISEDPTGRIALAYTDALGVQVRTSTDGVDFSSPALTVAAPSGASLGDLQVAATTDGGGFVAYVQNPVGAEGSGTVDVAAFGTQQATGKPGLGPLPGGGIGSAVGDQLATSTCTTAGFGVLVAENEGGGCWGHEPKNPNLDVSLGEVDINGLRIIPDPGVRIGIDPKLHTIDTTGKVRVVLTAAGVNITLFHDELHAKIPTGAIGEELFDLHEKQPPLVEGFPIDGDVDIKLVKGGVQIPISLTLPAYFGGITGSATLEATMPGGLKLKSLEFKVGDANFGALELKEVDVSYQLEGEIWKGEGEVQVPAGGGAVDAKVSVEFDKGKFVKGSLDVGLPYPGIPLDDTDPPPQLYLSHGGLELGLSPLKLAGEIGFGVTPLKPPGDGERRDYAFSLDGKLSVAFGKPVTITAEAQGYLYKMELANAKLVYKIPNQVSLDAEAKYDLGLIKFKGLLNAIVDPEHKIYAGKLKTAVFFHLPDPFSDLEIPGLTVEINNEGFAAYVPPPGFTIPAPPFLLFGTISYHWGDALPKVFLYQDKTGKALPVNPLVKHEGGTVSRVHARATAVGFTVPANAPTASLVVHGSGGAPSVVLVAPDGQRLDPAAKPDPSAATMAGAVQDAKAHTTYVGIQHPAAGNWRVEQAPGSHAPIARAEASVSAPGPKISAKLGGHGLRRTVRYRTSASAGLAIAFAEQTGSSLRVIGHAHAGSGTIRFRPAFGPAGRRSLVALVTHEGLPAASEQLGTFVVPRPPRPGRAKKLRVKAGKRALSFSFVPPANSAHTLLKIVATDGRHLQQIVKPGTRRGSVPAIGFRDGITVTVIGLGLDGSRGPAVSASARQVLHIAHRKARKHRPARHKHR